MLRVLLQTVAQAMFAFAGALLLARMAQSETAKPVPHIRAVANQLTFGGAQEGALWKLWRSSLRNR